MYFGARLVSDIAKRLEEEGRSDHLDDASALVEQLDAEVERLRQDLPAAMARLRLARGSES